MFWLNLFACTQSPKVQKDTGNRPTCTTIMERAVNPSTLSDIETLIANTRSLVPELDGVSLRVETIESDSTFLAAQVDLSTISNPPLEREYLIQINPQIFEQQITGASTVAILVHELKHVLDYTEMDTNALVEFGLWYAGGEVAEYERATDEFALERGCATGLIAFREWLYDFVSEEVRREKEVNYYTPDELRAWVEAN